MKNEFIKYVMNCHGLEDNGVSLYIPNLKTNEIKQAIEILEVTVDLQYDSLDRERVRDIILISRGEKPLGFLANK